MVALAIVFVVFAAVTFPTIQSAAAQASLVVRLTSGEFQGLSVANGTERWLGIPFAQPPTGSLRFKAPVEISNPPRGTVSAFTFGNACPQVPSSSLGAPMSEDCLNLNVSHPSKPPMLSRLIAIW